MKQQSGQFEPDERALYQAPTTLVPNVLVQLGLEGSREHKDATVSHLLQDLQAEHWQTRLAALEALSHYGERVPAEPLLRALHDEDPSVRASAVRLLGMRDDHLATTALQSAVHDPDWHVRETAVFALGGLISPPIDVLIRAQDDEDSAVREAATRMLQNIQREGFTVQSLPASEVLQAQSHSRFTKVYDYTNTMKHNIQAIGDRIAPRQRVLTYRHLTRIEDVNSRGKQHPIMRALEMVVAAVVVLGLVGSWFVLTHSIHTSTQGHTATSLTLKGKVLYHQAEMTPAVYWTSGSKYVYIYDKSNTVIHFIDIATKGVVATIDNPDLIAQSTAGKLATLTPDGLSVCTVDNTGSMLQIRVQSVLTNEIVFDANYPKIASINTDSILQWSNDGTRIALSSNNGNITIANVTKVQPLVVLRGIRTPVKALEWSNDDHQLLSTTADGHLQAWNTFTAQHLFDVTMRPDMVSPYLQAFSPDGKYITVVPDEQSIHILNAATGKVVLKIHDVMGSQGTYYQWIDGTHIISNNGVGTPNTQHIQIWDVVTGHIMLDIPIGTYDGYSTSSNYKYIVTQAINPTIFQVWDATTGRKVAIHNSSSTYLPGSSPNGKYFVTTGGGSDNKIDLWSPTTGKTVAMYYATDNSVVHAEWSPDGKYILSLSTNGRSNPVGSTLDLWQVPS